MNYFIKFLIKAVKHFVKDISYIGVGTFKALRKPSNYSYLILLISFLAVVYLKLSIFMLLGIIVLVYLRMQWIAGDIHKELKDETRGKIK